MDPLDPPWGSHGCLFEKTLNKRRIKAEKHEIFKNGRCVKYWLLIVNDCKC